MVKRKRNRIRRAPRLSSTSSYKALGLRFSIAKLMMAAGTTKFTTAGRKRYRNPATSIMPACHTIKVVMSPKGLKTPQIGRASCRERVENRGGAENREDTNRKQTTG